MRAAVPVRRPAELADVDALVIPGGESTTIVRLARIFDLLRADPRAARGRDACARHLRRHDHAGRPTRRWRRGAGTFGGLDIAVRRNAFGRQVDSFETEVDLAGFDPPFHAVFIRAPWVEEVGADVEVLATGRASPGRTAAGRIVAVRQGTLMATSFHPEITGDDRVHRYFVGLVIGSRPVADDH